MIDMMEIASLARVLSGARGRVLPPGAREVVAAALISSWLPGHVRARGCPQVDDRCLRQSSIEEQSRVQSGKVDVVMRG